MIFKIIFGTIAREGFKGAFERYSTQSMDLAARLSLTVEELIAIIEKNPKTFGAKQKNYREASLKVFPYTIIYKINQARKEVFITAFFHHKRSPRGKYSLRRVL